MQVRTHSPSSEHGAALAAALIVVTLVAGLGAGLLQLETYLGRRQAHALDTKRALYTAEAGISEAFHALVLGQSGNIGTDTEPAAFGGGVFWVEAEDLGDGRILLTSTGLNGSGRYCISVLVQPTPTQGALHGVLGLDGVKIGAGAILDGFDSEVAAYEAPQPGMAIGSVPGGASIASNGDVVVEGSPEVNTIVYGDVHPGSTGDLVADPNVTVTGTSIPLEDAVRLELSEVPGIESTGSLTATGKMPFLMTGEQRLSVLTISTRATMIIRGPAVAVFDTLVVADGGQLLIDSSQGPVEIHILDQAQFLPGSLLANEGGDAKQVTMHLGQLGGITEIVESGGNAAGNPNGSVELAANPFVFEPSGEFHGVIYGPTTDVNVPANLRVFGAVIGRSVSLDPGAQVSFDAALSRGEAVGAVTAGLPNQAAWTVERLPNVPLVVKRVDPLLQLKLQGIVPDPSNFAHKEKVLQLSYLDLNGASQTYYGDHRSFDWSLAKGVESVQWENPDTGDLLPASKIKTKTL